VEICLGEWTPRNIPKQVAEVVTDAVQSGVEAFRTALNARLMRVLAPFPEARAAVTAMFVEMHRQNVELPCSG
jgi:hypothetical protein